MPRLKFCEQDIERKGTVRRSSPKIPACFPARTLRSVPATWRGIFAWAALLLVQGLPAAALTIHVALDGSGDARSIQAGIDLSSTGDTVLVHPGHYMGNVSFQAKSISLIGLGGPESTIIEASSSDQPVVSIHDCTQATTSLQGFTVMGGHGGIYVVNSQPMIRGNIVAGNYGSGIGAGGGSRRDEPLELSIEGNDIYGNEVSFLGGGGVYLRGNYNARIAGNRIESNTVVGDGGGIYVYAYYNVSITDNIIISNTAMDHGGGLEYVSGIDAPEGLVAANIFAHNRAWGNGATGHSGGGVRLARGNVVVFRNTFAYNTGGPVKDWGGNLAIYLPGRTTIERNIFAFAELGGGIGCYGGATPVIRDNLAWKNYGGDGVGECEDIWDQEGNIIADPMFCAVTSLLFGVAEGSPALLHPAGPIGAYSSPTCKDVLVRPTTWGNLKARFARE